MNDNPCSNCIHESVCMLSHNLVKEQKPCHEYILKTRVLPCELGGIYYKVQDVCMHGLCDEIDCGFCDENTYENICDREPTVMEYTMYNDTKVSIVSDNTVFKTKEYAEVEVIRQKKQKVEEEFRKALNNLINDCKPIERKPFHRSGSK